MELPDWLGVGVGDCGSSGGCAVGRSVDDPVGRFVADEGIVAGGDADETPSADGALVADVKLMATMPGGGFVGPVVSSSVTAGACQS